MSGCGFVPNQPWLHPLIPHATDGISTLDFGLGNTTIACREELRRPAVGCSGQISVAAVEVWTIRQPNGKRWLDR